jgi:hypothetical protein
LYLLSEQSGLLLVPREFWDFGWVVFQPFFKHFHWEIELPEMVNSPARGDHSQPAGERAIVIASKAPELGIVGLVGLY